MRHCEAHLAEGSGSLRIITKGCIGRVIQPHGVIGVNKGSPGGFILGKAMTALAFLSEAHICPRLNKSRIDPHPSGIAADGIPRWNAYPCTFAHSYDPPLLNENGCRTHHFAWAQPGRDACQGYPTGLAFGKALGTVDGTPLRIYVDRQEHSPKLNPETESGHEANIGCIATFVRITH